MDAQHKAHLCSRHIYIDVPELATLQEIKVGAQKKIVTNFNQTPKHL